MLIEIDSGMDDNSQIVTTSPVTIETNPPDRLRTSSEQVQ
jgi:hypothetical protein